MAHNIKQLMHKQSVVMQEGHRAGPGFRRVQGLVELGICEIMSYT